ncbi:MAG TPA: response regulator [Caulobacterales bacterium]|nr:response regulator [Caulobacterales bacterium]
MQSLIEAAWAEEGVPALLPPPRELQILVVEDDEADAYLIQRALAASGRCNVLRAVDGVEALRLIDQGVKPDLAIIDLQMPRKNGFSLLVELGCAGCSFPTVVLTSSRARADWVRSKVRGAGEVLTKPDNLEELRDLLDEAIAGL